MKHLFKKDEINLESRFPKEKYVFGKVPVVYSKSKEKIPMVIKTNEIQDYDDIHEFIVVFRRLNWSIDNDLKRISTTFDNLTYRKRFNFELYCQNAIKQLLVLIIDVKNNKEKFMTEKAISNLHDKFTDGLIHYFFEFQPYQDEMKNEEQMLLSRDIYKYLSYQRRKARGIIQGEPPRCPSIIIESNLMEAYRLSLEEIRNLEPRDITALNIYMSQLNFEKFASSEARDKFFAKNDYGELEEFKSYDDLKKRKKLFEIDHDESDDDEMNEILNIKDKPDSNPSTSVKDLKEDVGQINNKKESQEDEKIGNLLIDLIDNSEKAANDFFEKAKRQNNIKKK